MLFSAELFVRELQKGSSETAVVLNSAGVYQSTSYLVFSKSVLQNRHTVFIMSIEAWWVWSLHVHTCEGQRSTLGIILYCSPLTLMKQGITLNLKLTDSAGLANEQAQNPCS